MTTATNTSDRLAKLRELMPQHQIGALVVPSEDQRVSLLQSSTLNLSSPFEQTLLNISPIATSAGRTLGPLGSVVNPLVLLLNLFLVFSGFTGSAGCAVITLKEAFLFTDGRYYLQASQQLDS